MSLIEEQIAPHVRGGMMSGTLGYAQPLRAIGQALETLQIQNFEVEPVVDGFFVRGTVPVANLNLLNDSFTADKLRKVWGSLPSNAVAAGKAAADGQANVSSCVELLYTEKDVDRLEEEGRARRTDSHRTANPSTLSQMLRCLGGYLSQKCARLLKVAREADSVCLEYETSMGTNMREILSVADVYDIWVRMYVQRSERAL